MDAVQQPRLLLLQAEVYLPNFSNPCQLLQQGRLAMELRMAIEVAEVPAQVAGLWAVVQHP